jgi:hypothetical protein
MSVADQVAQMIATPGLQKRAESLKKTYLKQSRQLNILVILSSDHAITVRPFTQYRR